MEVYSYFEEHIITMNKEINLKSYIAEFGFGLGTIIKYNADNNNFRNLTITRNSSGGISVMNIGIGGEQTTSMTSFGIDIYFTVYGNWITIILQSEQGQISIYSGNCTNNRINITN